MTFSNKIFPGIFLSSAKEAFTINQEPGTEEPGTEEPQFPARFEGMPDFESVSRVFRHVENCHRFAGMPVSKRLRM